MPLVNFIISATSPWLAVWANRFYAARHGQNWKSREDEMIKKERKNEREEGKHYESAEGWKTVKEGWRKERKKEKMEKKAEKSKYDWSLESPQILPQIYVELKVTKGKDKERKKKKRRSKRARKNKKRGGKKGEKGGREEERAREEKGRRGKSEDDWPLEPPSALGTNIRLGRIYSYKLSGSFAGGRTQREICLH